MAGGLSTTVEEIQPFAGFVFANVETLAAEADSEVGDGTDTGQPASHTAAGTGAD